MPGDKEELSRMPGDKEELSRMPGDKEGEEGRQEGKDKCNISNG